MSTLKVNKIENTATTNGGVQIDVDGHVTIDGQQLPTAGPLSNRNMIINGNMLIAQRGTSVAIPNSSNLGYGADRFVTHYASTELQGTLTREYDSATGVPDLPCSLKWTTTTAEASVTGSDLLYVAQYIEGFNAQPPKFGTSNAQQTTLSFWVKCSIAGTYNASIYRSDAVRNIVTTYTINSANTWEYKTITFPADTTGVVTPDNGEGLRINWLLMAGPNYIGTDASSWGPYVQSRWASTGVNNTIPTTTGATWEITGVQYEVGSKSTPFEHRSYGDELAKCMRYYQKTNNTPVFTNTPTGTGMSAIPMWYSGDTNAHGRIFLPVRMRTPPSASFIGNESAGSAQQGTHVTGDDGTIGFYYVGAWQSNDTWSFAATETTENSVRVNAGGLPRGSAGNAGGLYFYGSASTATIILNAEL